MTKIGWWNNIPQWAKWIVLSLMSALLGAAGTNGVEGAVITAQIDQAQIATLEKASANILVVKKELQTEFDKHNTDRDIVLSRIDVKLDSIQHELVDIKISLSTKKDR